MTQVKRKEVLDTSSNDRQQQYLTFILGGENFAIGILAIKEIIEYGHLTEVPRMPNFIRGVINLRGAVVPVVDLSVRFGKRSTKVGRRTCIVILEVDYDNNEVGDIGILVDAVNEVLEIPESEIEPPPAFGASIRTQFISGMGKVNERFVIILNIANTLLIEDISSIVADVASNSSEVDSDD